MSQETVYVSYFVGRLNPPHNGHISALKSLVNTARQNRSKALILLGSGPKQVDADKRTMDDPITFETKKAFVVKKLVESGAEEGADFTVQEMKNLFGDVTHYVVSTLQDTNPNRIHITHLAGGKDEDATKLESVLKYVTSVAKEKVPGAEVIKKIEVAAPPSSSGKYMSATKVRNDTYETQSNGTGYEGWPETYKTFYGDSSRKIYEEILYPLQKISSSEKTAVIRNYIDNGTLPKIRIGTRKKRKGYYKSDGSRSKSNGSKSNGSRSKSKSKRARV